MKRLVLIFLTSFLFFSGTVNSEELSVESKKELKKSKFDFKKIFKNVSVTLESSVSTDLYSWSSINKGVSSSYSVGPNYKLNKKTSIGANFSIAKGLTNTRDQSLSDGVIYVGRSFGNITENISLSVSGTVLVPISDSSRYESSLRTGMIIRPALKIKLKKIKLEKFTLTLAPSASKYFHKYTTSFSGRANTSYSVKGSLGLSFQPVDYLVLSTSLSLNQGFTYRHNPMNASFSNSLSATYLYKAFSATAGFSGGGAMYENNGQDLRMDMFASESTSFFTSFTYTI